MKLPLSTLTTCASICGVLTGFLCSPVRSSAQTVVYSSYTPGLGFYGSGAYGITNNNNGDAALGYPGYIGGSPAFAFVPTGIPNGDNLTEFKVGIGDDYNSGVRDFHLTLFTSGSSYQQNDTLWTKIGYYAGQTDGSFDSSSDTPVTVAASLSGGFQLTNGNHYYLMGTVDAGQGPLDWGDYYPAEVVWEPYYANYFAPTGFTDGTGIFQVIVGPQVSPATPEPGPLAAAAGFALSGLALLLQRRGSKVNPH